MDVSVPKGSVRSYGTDTDGSNLLCKENMYYKVILNASTTSIMRTWQLK